MKTYCWTIACAALLTLSNEGSAQANAAQPFRLSADTAALAPGDMVRITVWRKAELSGEFIVTGTGAIAHPLYREVRVTGIPLTAVETRLRVLLEKYEANPQFVVEPLLRVAVGGEVRLPNLYNLPPETSVSQAVALAGGATERGHRDRLRLMRAGSDMMVDLKRADITGAGMPIRSGDQITVERTTAVFRDYIAPTIGVLGGIASIAAVLIYNRDD